MANKYLSYDGLIYLWSKIKTTFVAKETGKGLSTNDYTTAEKTKLSGIAENANNYSLPTASASTLGGVKVGANLSITDGVLSADAQAYTLPTASASVKGGIKIGDNLTMNGETLSANALPVMKIKGSVASIDDNQTITLSVDTKPTSAQFLDAIDAKRSIFLDIRTGGTPAGVAVTDLIIPYHRKVWVAGTAAYEFSLQVLATQYVVLVSTASTELTVDNLRVNTISAAAVSAIPTSAKGAASGVCPLNSSSKIDSTYLPSYVDDVVEGYYDSTTGKFYSDSAKTQEITGETGKIYVDLSTNLSYRYGGSAYVVITSSDMTALTNSEIDAAIAAA